MSKASDEAKRRQTPCLACGKVPTDICHIRSRGAGGKDEPWNLIPLCRADHALQHFQGWERFLMSYPHVKKIIEKKGWEITHMYGKYLMTHSGDLR